MSSALASAGPELDAPPVGRRHGWLRLLVAALAGLATGLSFEPYALWPLLALSLPAFTLTVFGQPLRRSFGLGYAFGLGMLGVAVNWVHVLGWWVAVLLIVFEALFFGLLGLALSLVSRLRWWPLAAACCWVMIEFAYARAPFGGFGWTRIAYAAVDTPLAGWLPMIGVAGLSFLVALVGQLIAWAAAPASSSTTAGRRTRVAVSAGVALALALGGIALRTYEPEPAVPSAGTVDVGVVQGNVPGRGIEALGRARSVTNNHLTETVDLMAQARLGQVPMPDFILWPENSTDIDPQLDSITRSVVWSAARIAGRPILVGAVTQGPGDDERQTTAMWWDPTYGVLATYHKRNLVPFGEWIPFRDQLLPLVPILADVGAQSVPGTQPGVLRVPVGGRELRVGDVICFELAYDATVYDAVRGSQVLMVQSNNATYGGTGQVEQQFAITRARAMEARREIAVATTNSVSGYIDRDGTIVRRTDEFTHDAFVEAMPLRSAITPALRVAPWLDRGLALAGLVFCVVASTRIGVRRQAGARSGTLDGTSSPKAAAQVDSDERH
ncbi:MAG TPA: apolipoprotein N-acyltransferase [Microlunatus sp.]|nr:apolipoprotein N-acyltransferase [Microlunatus sp.]